MDKQKIAVVTMLVLAGLLFVAGVGCMLSGIWVDDYYLGRKLIKSALPLYFGGMICGWTAFAIGTFPKSKK